MEPSPPQPHPWASAPWLLAGFLALLAVNTWHHAPWSDELHAWGLVLASRDPAELIGNLRYEGHPPLWHLLLWCGHRLSDSWTVGKLLHLAIAAATILLIVRRAPFRPVEKALLLAHYFLLFEYTVIARNYGIGLLLALVYAVLRTAPAPRPFSVALTLGLMGNTNVYAFMLAGLLSLEYAWWLLGRARWSGATAAPRLLAAALLYGALMLGALAVAWPPPDVSQLPHKPTPEDLRDPLRFGLQLLRALVPPFLPVDFSFPESFAFPGAIYTHGKRVWFCLALAPAILLALWLIFRRHATALMVVLAAVLAAGAFSFTFYPAAIRHLGVVFTAFLTMLWIIRRSDPDPSPTARAAVLALLLLGAAGGALSLAGQWMRPFAVNGQAVAWLRANGLADAAIIGYPDIRIEPVAVLLDRPFHALECQCEARFVRLDHDRDGFTTSDIAPRLDAALRRHKPERVVILTGEPLPMPAQAALLRSGWRLNERAHFSGAERDQAMWVFTVTRTGAMLPQAQP